MGLSLHANEIVKLGSLEDCRSIFSLHAGFTGVQGSAWTKAGVGSIARPGLMQGKIEMASLELRRFFALMAFLLGDVLVDRMLIDTCRSDQGKPCDTRLDMQGVFYDWLGVKLGSHLRTVDAITISFSAQGAAPHYDSQNDSRPLFDHICWAVHYPTNLIDYLNPGSCRKLISHGINPAERVGFTFIAYTRAVIGQQVNLCLEIAKVGCPLFSCYTAELNNKSPDRHDVGNLDNVSKRANFLQELESLRTKNDSNDYKFGYAIRPETNSRDILLGSMLHLWMLFVHAYLGSVCYTHCLQFVIFIGKETNGPMLVYQVVTEWVMSRKQKLGKCTRNVLADTIRRLSFFIFLSQLYIQKRAGAKYPSVNHRRWQPRDRLTYLEEGDEHRVDFLIDYVGGAFVEVQNAMDDEDCGSVLLRLCEKEERNKLGLNSFQRSILTYGPIKGNFTIQLAARFGIIHPKWESFSRMVKGKNGFYKCVNHHLRGKYARDLSTVEAEEEVAAVMKSLLQMRHTVDTGVLDQVGCRWYRQYTNQLKNDIFFWDGHNDQLMNFYRRKLTKKGYQIQIFHGERWRNLSEYVTPFYSLVNLSSATQEYAHEGRSKKLFARWIKDLPSNSLHPELI